MRTAALLLAGCAALVATGCGSHSRGTPAELRLQREDLVAVTRVLQQVQRPVGEEVARTKAAWPLVLDGLPAAAAARPLIHAAAESAARLAEPALFQEAQSATLTGSGAALVGLFHDFYLLSRRGWQMIEASLDAREHGTNVASRFAQANVALYIESVYDAHFTLAQIGKQLLAGYRRLGDAAAFGAALTPEAVQALAQTYSEASDRLLPHVGVRLGS